ncbi:hypothetical protein [Luteibaculum oceani]|uniref:Uncharacterized protein n=1 Tax=Luteibaculum oceani TaxID=1294296 RepID=A0A5C6UYG8_9FLAO|nr:hypothetical protein [Luteibaculum oceani]TXC78462.1 hypothetical protein FRX97_09015 [Luteibaculum oceani]
MHFKTLLAILFSLGLVSSSFAKEYENLIQYRAQTGKTELSRKDWLEKDRKNNTKQWKESCLFNFSYAGGNKEYRTMEERLDFYEWVAEYLENKGHEIDWPEATEELSRYMLKTQRPAFDSDIQLFCRATHKVVFDTAFTLLQEVKNMQQPLKGEAAKEWDKKMFFFEHSEIYQPLLVKMDNQSVTKLNKIMHRKGFAAFSIPIELKLKGQVENLNDRLYWAENKLLPFATGTALSAKELKNKEKLKKKELKMQEKQNGKEEISKPVIIATPEN